MLKIELQCPGKHGSNGCPEQRSLTEWSDHGVEQLQEAWAKLRKAADDAWWERDTVDLTYRCPDCCGLQTVSGYSLDVWDRAFALWKAGKPPSEWGGKDGLPTLRQWHNAVHRIEGWDKRLEDSPLFKPRAERNKVLPQTMWARVLDRFQSGEDKKDICTGGEWPTAKQWNAKMERDEAFRQAIHDEWDKRSAAAEAEVDATYERWSTSGEDLITAALDNRAVVQRWYKRVSEDPEFAAKVKAVKSTREREKNERFIEALYYVQALKAEQMRKRNVRFDKAIEHMEAGGYMSTLPPTAATPAMIRRRRGRDPAFAALWYASIPERAPVFDLSLDWDKMLDKVKDGDALADLSGRNNMPTISQWNYRRRKDKGFARAADEAIACGKQARYLAAPIGAKFTQQLSQNDMYAAVNAVVPVGLPAHIRDDIIGAMVLAILEGEMTIDEVGARAKEYKSQYHKVHETYKLVSADQTVPGTDDLKLIDKISNEDSLWYEH